jgi:hypothetical protein
MTTEVTLAECPPGVFLFEGTLGFKTEYGMTLHQSGEWKVTNYPDAYCLDSGEVFWGGTKDHIARAALLVRPVEVTAYRVEVTEMSVEEARAHFPDGIGVEPLLAKPAERKCGECRGSGVAEYIDHMARPCDACHGNGFLRFTHAEILEMEPVTPEELHILKHSLGLTKGGLEYRNHFVTGKGSTDYPQCMALIDKGLMTRRDGSPLTGGDDLFRVTEEGKKIARETPTKE